jgi:hypothetical protein
MISSKFTLQWRVEPLCNELLVKGGFMRFLPIRFLPCLPYVPPEGAAYIENIWDLHVLNVCPKLFAIEIINKNWPFYGRLFDFSKCLENLGLWILRTSLITTRVDSNNCLTLVEIMESKFWPQKVCQGKKFEIHLREDLFHD